MNNFQLTKNFNLREFESPDTHEVKISNELVTKLQAVRNEINCPIYITSGYRTPEHNAKVGGHEHSRHMKGLAVDVTVQDFPFIDFKAMCLMFGFERVITYHDKNFLHIQIKRG